MLSSCSKPCSSPYLNCLLVHARLEDRLGHLERLWIARLDLALEKSSHLHVQLVPEDREHGGARPVVRDHGLLDEAATGELVEVVAGVGGLVELVQQVGGGLDASLPLFSISFNPSGIAGSAVCAPGSVITFVKQ